MAHIKYYYNTQTCKYERIKVSKWTFLFSFLGLLASSLITVLFIFFIYNHYFDLPKEVQLKKENKSLNYFYNLLQKEIETTKQSLVYLQERDTHIYRTIFKAAPISSAVKKAGSSDRVHYQDLNDKRQLIGVTFKKVDRLRKQIDMQAKSYDKLLSFAKNKATRLACLPAIQPISNKGLNRLASGYGIRIDPFSKLPKMHYGVDFFAPRGSPVYATGNGIVKVVKANKGGYGKHIEIKHGYGYTTKYAHLASFNVQRGQQVKRGQCIGYVGNTGVATSPHLHYEVIKNNKRVNPLDYFIAGDLTAEDYKVLRELASIKNQSLS